jgi:DNA repair exonuclease SbcCD ATPase subunit
MSDRTIPTLEEIANYDYDALPHIEDLDIMAELAAVLIVHNRRLDALFSQVDALNEQVGALSALEQQARPYQEGGELAATVSAAEVILQEKVYALEQRAEAAEQERDELIEREHELVCQREDLRQSLADEISKADAARATVERLTAALQRIASFHDPDGPHRWVAEIAAAALKETP